MHIIAPGAIARPYQIIGLNYLHQPVLNLYFETLEELARSISWMEYTVSENAKRWFVSERDAVRLKVLSARNKTLNVAELVTWGRRLRAAGYRGRYGYYVFREGSVSGISKWRGGSSCRNSRAQNERRGNALCIAEEGEVAARAVRQGSYLPNSWDGRRRSVEHCWKSQHKGSKSWDRPPKHGKGGNT